MLLPDAAVKLQGDNYRPRQTLDILYVPDVYVLTSLLEIMSLTLQPTLTKISDEGSSQTDSLIAKSHVYFYKFINGPNRLFTLQTKRSETG